ncbi:MAG: TRAP transporter substrate-binding protein DctP [Alphaproteobacteria bacterium]|nr:TRAP transporter substrate-binding protein DctP [Alphaproteobacteria bacterium]
MKTNLKTIMLAAGAAAVIGASSGSANAAATELTLVNPFPDFLIYTKLCKELVKKINTRGKGVVSIKILPFNSIGMFKQPPAVRAGRVDIACTPAAFYARGLPEAEAVATSNSSPSKVRANGGMKLLDGLHQKHFKLKYLGWTAAGGRFRIYMKKPPKFSANGLIDFSGVKLRDNPIYGAFFRAMKATTHTFRATETYSALEKGVVDAAAWATIGIKGLKWDKFLRHAVEPEFFQTDIGWIMNLKKWKSLNPAAQKLLQTTIIEHEDYARAKLMGLAAAERKTLMAEGMKFYTVPNPKAYVNLAVDSAYKRMIDRLKKAGRSTDIATQLRAAYRE